MCKFRYLDKYGFIPVSLFNFHVGKIYAMNANSRKCDIPPPPPREISILTVFMKKVVFLCPRPKRSAGGI